jgi:hypothetical protein
MSRRDGGPVDQLCESKGIPIDEFGARVREEGEVVKEHIAGGTFDNDQVTGGSSTSSTPSGPRATNSDGCRGTCSTVSASRRNSGCTAPN